MEPDPEDPDQAVAELLADHSSAVTSLTLRLRKAIRDAFADGDERLYRRWRGLGYHLPGAGYVCAIFPKDGYVEVGFEHGADLKDKNGLLSRGGRQVRYARFDTWEPDRVDQLIELIDQAAHRQQG